MQKRLDFCISLMSMEKCESRGIQKTSLFEYKNYRRGILTSGGWFWNWGKCDRCHGTFHHGHPRKMENFNAWAFARLELMGCEREWDGCRETTCGATRELSHLAHSPHMRTSDEREWVWEALPRNLGGLAERDKATKWLISHNSRRHRQMAPRHPFSADSRLNHAFFYTAPPPEVLVTSYGKPLKRKPQNRFFFSIKDLLPMSKLTDARNKRHPKENLCKWWSENIRRIVSQGVPPTPSPLNIPKSQSEPKKEMRIRRKGREFRANTWIWQGVW